MWYVIDMLNVINMWSICAWYVIDVLDKWSICDQYVIDVWTICVMDMWSICDWYVIDKKNNKNNKYCQNIYLKIYYTIAVSEVARTRRG